MHDLNDRRSTTNGSHGILRLFYTPGAKSQGAHIALEESGLAFELVKLHQQAKNADVRNDFSKLSPFGRTPLLELTDGSTLRQAPVIMEYVADLAPEAGLAPKCGTIERVKLLEWMHLLSNELDDRSSPPSVKKRLAWIDVQLAVKPYLLGATYSIADILLWALWNRVAWRAADVIDFKNIEGWHLRIALRKALRTALEAER